MRGRCSPLAGLALALLAAGALRAAEPAVEARCRRVLDGDSVVLRLDGREVEARLDGIDAPERGQPFGDRARRELTSLVAGRMVDVTHRGTDRHGRLLVRLRIAGLDVNAALVRRGFAWHFVRYSDDEVLAAAEREARAARSGLWASEAPIPPWAWRDGVRTPAAASRLPSAGLETERAQPARPTTAEVLHGNARSFVYHRPGCPNYDCRNCTRVFGSAAEAEAAGYRAAGCCRPSGPPQTDEEPGARGPGLGVGGDGGGGGSRTHVRKTRPASIYVRSLRFRSSPLRCGRRLPTQAPAPF